MEDEDEPVATGHGSPYDHDQLVPVLVLAPGRTRHAPLGSPNAAPLPMTLAGVLRSWLGL